MKPPEIKQLGIRIKELRKARRLGLVELAERTELSASYISRIERGVTSASLESLVRLAKALLVTIAELFEPQPSPTKENQGTSKGGPACPE